MPLDGIDPPFSDYQSDILPLNYRGKIGRGTWNRTTVDWLKASYSTIELHPQYLASLEGFEPPYIGLEDQCVIHYATATLFGAPPRT